MFFFQYHHSPGQTLRRLPGDEAAVAPQLRHVEAVVVHLPKYSDDVASSKTQLDLQTNVRPIIGEMELLC